GGGGQGVGRDEEGDPARPQPGYLAGGHDLGQVQASLDGGKDEAAASAEEVADQAPPQRQGPRSAAHAGHPCLPRPSSASVLAEVELGGRLLTQRVTQELLLTFRAQVRAPLLAPRRPCR